MSSWSEHVHPHGEWVSLASNLWVITGSMANNALPRNMVVYRLPSGGLWIHSAIALNEQGMKALESFGEPEVLVVPNRFHRLDAAVYKARFPRLTVCCPESARSAVESVLPVDQTDASCCGALGIRLHAPAGPGAFEHLYELKLEQGVALVCCDTVFNIRQHLGGVFGLIARYLTQSTGYFGVTRIGRFFLGSGRAQLKAWFIEQADRSDVAVFCMSHGDVLTSEIPAHLRSAAGRL